jgi:hypothetical protein
LFFMFVAITVYVMSDNIALVPRRHQERPLPGAIGP